MSTLVETIKKRVAADIMRGVSKKVSSSKQRGLNNKERKQVKRIVDKRRETKTIDQASSNTVQLYSSSTDMYNLTPIAQGNGQHERQALEVMLNRIVGRVAIWTNPSATSQRFVRFTVFSWDFPAAPQATDLYSLADILSPIKSTFYEGHKGFILRDFVMTVSASDQIKVRNLNLKKRQKVAFSGTLATNIAKGTIWICVGADNADTNISYQFSTRAFYKDM